MTTDLMIENGWRFAPERSLRAPLYGLWLPGAGANGQGRVLLQTHNLEPAFFLTSARAEQAALAEKMVCGLELQVIELVAPEAEDLPRACEGCAKPATATDVDGVPLCGDCMQALIDEGENQ